MSAGNGKGASLSLTYTEPYAHSYTDEEDGLEIERRWERGHTATENKNLMEILDDLFLPEEQSLGIEIFISGCDHSETKAAVKEFGFNDDAIVMFIK